MRLSTLIKILLFLPLLAPAADELTVYRTKYRVASELLATAQPLFFGKATFSSLDDKIVISAPASVTKSVLELFAELDRKPKQFRLSTRLVTAGAGNARGVGMEVDARTKHGSIQKRSGSVSERAGRASVVGISVGAEEVNTQSAGAGVQTIELTEGYRASVLSGSDWLPGGVFATVRSAGKSATVEFHHKESANPSLGTQSEITLPLGVWRTVARSGETSQNKRGEILGVAGGQNMQDKELQVKVELSR